MKSADAVGLDEFVAHIHEKSDKTTTAKRIRLSLVHIHIPKLIDYGVIEYDRQNENIRYRKRTKLETLLEAMPMNAQSA
ncbi:hypothetical protein ACFFQF_28665 [Haladaptatus pallidirubidus]|uniref:DUF7344 domain-containing protein n=2 Tax=Haladaptatus pallidirubidus TaxID=1008152 RepID=A0AAV3UJI8_9EURY|nr:hypothetical protein [Haladaptatus pallidirubidus]